MDACWFCQATVAMQWYTHKYTLLSFLWSGSRAGDCAHTAASRLCKGPEVCQTATHWLSMLTALSLCHHFHWKWSELAVLLAPQLLAACAGGRVTSDFFYFPSCRYVWMLVHVHVRAFLSTHFNGIQNTELLDQASPPWGLSSRYFLPPLFCFFHNCHRPKGIYDGGRYDCWCRARCSFLDVIYTS